MAASPADLQLLALIAHKSATASSRCSRCAYAHWQVGCRRRPPAGLTGQPYCFAVVLMCAAPQRHAFAPLSTCALTGSPAVSVLVQFAVMHPIVSCIAHLSQVDSLLPPEGFLTGVLVRQSFSSLSCGYTMHNLSMQILMALNP